MDTVRFGFVPAGTVVLGTHPDTGEARIGVVFDDSNYPVVTASMLINIGIHGNGQSRSAVPVAWLNDQGTTHQGEWSPVEIKDLRILNLDGIARFSRSAERREGFIPTP